MRTSSIICCICGANIAHAFHLDLRQTSFALPSDKIISSTTLRAIKWPSFQKASIDQFANNENGFDSEYPWRFEGRFIYRPSLVRVPTDNNDFPSCSSLISVFGYTLGGSVVLEYDVSPVGPYREYVEMGGVVALGRVGVGESLDDTSQMKSLGIGQWGTNLYVSTQAAEDVCKEVWGVPAALATIEFEEDGKRLQDGPDEIGNYELQKFNLSGWGNTRIMPSDAGSSRRFGNVPIFWTPTIKALWAPIYFPFKNTMNNEQSLPVHKLRLSASAMRLKLCEKQQPKSSEVPLGLALVVDNVLIEIGRRATSGNL
jgi:hypothetical protein